MKLKIDLRQKSIQIPVNALDRRAIHSGLLRRLKTKGVEIHARSVFLQGLLLMQPTELPEFFSRYVPTLPRCIASGRTTGLIR